MMFLLFTLIDPWTKQERQRQRQILQYVLLLIINFELLSSRLV